jgi:hypothetical protein
MAAAHPKILVSDPPHPGPLHVATEQVKNAANTVSDCISDSEAWYDSTLFNILIRHAA